MEPIQCLMVIKLSHITYSLSTRFGGRGLGLGVERRMQFSNRTLPPKSPFFKGGL